MREITASVVLDERGMWEPQNHFDDEVRVCVRALRLPASSESVIHNVTRFVNLAYKL